MPAQIKEQAIIQASCGELDDDVLGVATPIRDARQRVVAAISVAAVARRALDSRILALADAAHAAVEEISQALALMD